MSAGTDRGSAGPPTGQPSQTDSLDFDGQQSLNFGRGSSTSSAEAKQKAKAAPSAEQTRTDINSPKSASFIGKAKRFWEDVTGV